MSREQIIASNPLNVVIESYGIMLHKKGSEIAGLCPFHPDKSPSLRVNVQKQTWFCDPCQKGGSVIDFVAMKDGISVGDAMRKLSKETSPLPPTKNKEVCRYEYKDEKGDILYKVVRYEPKTFRQCHAGADGKAVWNMEGVRRVLYNLPQVIKAKGDVWIVEGEKDVESLKSLGLVATCNVGGAGKWMDGYTDHLKDKDVVICPDNDDAGKRHLDVVMSSLAGKVKSVCVVRVPSGKDVSDFIATFPDKEAAGNALLKIKSEQPVITAGMDLPIFSMEELEIEYKEFIKDIEHKKLNVFSWLKGFENLRGLVPGDSCTIVADTGTGKTAIVQNIAANHPNLTFLIFELELPSTDIFERFIQIQESMTGHAVENGYRLGNPPAWKNRPTLKNIFVCPKAKLTPDNIRELIVKSELKIGKKPDVVIVDYIGLVKGSGRGRYEAVSNNAEELKVVAKETKTIVICTSQVHRDKNEKEISIHDAKDSGSIENSSQLVIGAWRPSEDTMILRVLKGNKGGSGIEVQCDFDGKKLKIYNGI